MWWRWNSSTMEPGEEISGKRGRGSPDFLSWWLLFFSSFPSVVLFNYSKSEAAFQRENILCPCWKNKQNMIDMCTIIKCLKMLVEYFNWHLYVVFYFYFYNFQVRPLLRKVTRLWCTTKVPILCAYLFTVLEEWV